MAFPTKKKKKVMQPEVMQPKAEKGKVEKGKVMKGKPNPFAALTKGADKAAHRRKRNIGRS